MIAAVLTADVKTLPSGRRLANCPGCCALVTPAAGVVELNCRHCGTFFQLIPIDGPRKRTKRKRPQQVQAPLEQGGGPLDCSALAELSKAR
jgi:hypothetical protein